MVIFLDTPKTALPLPGHVGDEREPVFPAFFTGDVVVFNDGLYEIKDVNIHPSGEDTTYELSARYSPDFQTALEYQLSDLDEHICDNCGFSLFEPDMTHNHRVGVDDYRCYSEDTHRYHLILNLMARGI